MKIDPAAAQTFLATHARLLDRRRSQLLFGAGSPREVFTALEAYGNDDGGYGWGLEPDLRSPSSQPAAVMHALEVLGEVAPLTTPRAVALCDWLQRQTLADGGLPFALPITDPEGCAPFWVHADPGTSSLQMTLQVAAGAHMLGRHQAEIAGHPWLRSATEYCVEAIRRLGVAPDAHTLMFGLQLLDALQDDLPEVGALVRAWGSDVGTDGSVPVEGGAEGERLYALDLAPAPGSAARALFSDDVVTADLTRLAAAQQDNGGWSVGFTSYSPAAASDWRGYATVQAMQVLRANAAA